MPAYEHRDLSPWQTVTVHLASGRSIKVHFRNKRDVDAFWQLTESHVDAHANIIYFTSDIDTFSSLIGQRISDTRKSVWYPQSQIDRYADKRYISDRPLQPLYPIYVISKGRWDKPLTAMALEKCGVPYRIVVEPHEYDNYASMIDSTRILTLPFSNLGMGSTPARNWVWDHAVRSGVDRHWILDDNIYMFMRFHENMKIPVADGTIFRLAESYVDRYENVAVSGFNYLHFIERKKGNRYPPVRVNTRIYSCILIQNDIPYRWRGKYNEDTDLCIRALKDGWVTMLFNAFLADKTTTMRMTGGNTDELYRGNGFSLGRLSPDRLTSDMQDAVFEKAMTLKRMHPDIVEVKKKWGRWHHEVDYSHFRGNSPVKRSDYCESLDNSDDFGFRIVNVTPNRRLSQS